MWYYNMSDFSGMFIFVANIDNTNLTHTMTPIRQARTYREQLSEFRRKRNRCRDYTYGRQWNDIIEVDGRKITEYEYILSEGNVPLKNNLIRRIVRNVLGVFRERLPAIMKEEYGEPLATIARENSLAELFTRTLEEFLISGMAVVRKRISAPSPGSSSPAKPRVTTEMVSPDDIFFNTDSHDIRGWDLHTIGQVHKVNFTDWCRAFVKSRTDYRKAQKLFDTYGREVKVTELWRKELVARYLVHDRHSGKLRKQPVASSVEGASQWMLDEVWRYYFLTEDGTELLSGDSPYPDGSHPFVIKCYPFLDGEIQSFVGDMIDQQRYTNRLITLYDWVIRASAKGVLLLPEGAVDNSNIRAVADQWSRFNGVIVYKNKPGNPEPKQINSNVSNLAISELLEIQLKMMEDVSGVNGILQGRTSGGNVSGELYNSQTTNALYSLSDILETFTAFIRDNATKDRVFTE